MNIDMTETCQDGGKGLVVVLSGVSITRSNREGVSANLWPLIESQCKCLQVNADE